MWIKIMSRRDACNYCEQQHDEPCAIISILDPRMDYVHSPFRNEKNHVIDILELMFSDADRPGLDVCGNIAGTEDLMSGKDADMVAEFVKKHRGVNLIVHCDAGISRSSGVAAAIMKHLNGSDQDVFQSKYYRPNMWCYRQTLNALMVKEVMTDE